MDMIKKWAVAGLLLLSPLALAGCWDRKEINDVAFVIGSSVDKENGMYRSALQIPLPGNLGGAGSKGGGGGTSGGKSYYLESKTGITLRSANMEIQAGNSRNLSFSHRRVLLIGEDFARDGIAPMLDQFARIPQNRLSSLVAVTSGSAYKILDAAAPMEQFSSEMIRELINEFTKRPDSLKQLVNTLMTDGVDVALPYLSIQEAVPPGVGTSKNNIQVTGLALFDEDKFVGALEGQEGKIINLAMNQAPSPDIIVDGPGGKGHISIRFSENEAKLKPVVRGNDITMTIEIYAKGAVYENDSNSIISDEHSLRDLERRASEEIVDKVQLAMRSLQHKYNSDILGFGRSIYENDPKAWQKFKGNWKKAYPEVRVIVKPELHIENIGAVGKPFGRKEIRND
ncbi:putative spore germination protein YfkR [Paenibacillus cineris]|nr:putative spore germination protein YfkR [Paenibacillus cineris]